MDELGLFTAALGLSGPWRVTRSDFDAEATQLDLYLGFDRGARFAYPARDRTHGEYPCTTRWTAGRPARHAEPGTRRAPTTLTALARCSSGRLPAMTSLAGTVPA